MDKDSTSLVSLPEPPRRPSAEVIHLNDRRGAPAKGNEQADRPMAEHPRAEGPHKLINESRLNLEAYGLVVFATAAVLVAGSYLWVKMQSSNRSSMIQTTAAETKRTTLQGDVVASLSPGATLWVDGRGQSEQAYLVEGKATFDVPARAEPFEILTHLAIARASVPSKFSVAAGTDVEFQVHAGEIEIAPVGAKKHGDVIRLKPGRSVRLMGAAVAGEWGEGRASPTRVASRSTESLPTSYAVGPSSNIAQDGL